MQQAVGCGEKAGKAKVATFDCGRYTSHWPEVDTASSSLLVTVGVGDTHVQDLGKAGETGSTRLASPEAGDADVPAVGRVDSGGRQVAIALNRECGTSFASVHSLGSFTMGPAGSTAAECGEPGLSSAQETGRSSSEVS